MKTHVLSGLDNLNLADGLLRGKRIGYMTNPTGIDHSLWSGIDILHEKYRLSALYSCEHGVRGDAQAGDEIGTYVDKETGVTVYSVFGKNKRMTPEMLDAFDVLVFDIQDVGVRFYTYLYSLSYAMEACCAAGKPIVVLDRVDPISGAKREGTILNLKFHSFVGDYELPTRTGLTLGEYARYIKDYLHLKALDLTVVPLSNWTRALYLDETDLPWVAPSPNCATLNAALCYIGTCVFEGTNLSEGRGTTLPFEVIGAPYIDGAALEKKMASLHLPGVHFRRTAFKPTFSKHQGELCFGVQVHVTDRNAYRGFDSGLYLLDAVRELFPDKFEYIRWSEKDTYSLDLLLGTDEFRLGMSAKDLIAKYAPGVECFSEKVKPYLLYE